MDSNCPECGAQWQGSKACEEAFYQMGYWEMDDHLLDVHHLMVLSYYLQHPSLYSQEGLREARRLLVGFVEGGQSPQDVVKREHDRLDSGARGFKIKGKPGARGAYPRPVRWTMTAVDVVARGEAVYYESVREWARSVLAALRQAGIEELNK